MLTRIVLGVVWLLRLLPLSVLAPIGQGLGMLLYVLARERRFVTLTNLRLCFPELDAHQRARIARAHFRGMGRVLIEQSIAWWSSPGRLQKMVKVEDRSNLDEHLPGQVIVLGMHFIGLELGAIRLSMDYGMIDIYSHQKDPVFDAVLLKGRGRFGRSLFLSRQDGIRAVVRAMKEGWSLFYLPDMDLGPKDSIFVPFFGVQAATVPGLSRMARLTRARVIPLVIRQLPGGQGYAARFYPAWENFPTEDVEADTRRMNAFIEERVREMPEQYYWLHKRFKTRPPGEARFYP
jgi:KDO2-lipid IV(A) lauroyltransferase